ncbi:MAG: FliA/WhiG family RNA polymerase sigma factor [Armatimonadota bacterium]
MLRMNDLWQRYKTQKDDEARQQIILAYAYLAKYVVDRMNLRPNAVVSYDDLVSNAIMGLIDAVEKFDPGKDVKFETYASVRIRGAVLDVLKSLDWKPRSVQSSASELRRVFAKLEARFGRAATDEEVAAEMGIDIDTLNGLLVDIGQSSVVSLEELMACGDEYDGLGGSNTACGPDGDPMFVALIGERKQLLVSAIDGLPEKEKLVISLYYKDGLTLKEIAAVLGVTESRACQLHSKAVVRLHGKLARHEELLLAAA